MRIVPVDKETEKIWAELCSELWPDNTTDSIIDEVRGERSGEGKGGEFLYFLDDTPAGFINLTLRRDYVEGTDSSPVAYVEGIYVRQEFRNKGIAKEMIEFAKGWAISNGCSFLASDCELSNETSRLFHNKTGFKEANKIICFTMQLKNG